MDLRLTRKDLTRKPYRGIYSEIARERGITPQAVVRAVWVRKNVEIRELVLAKIQERQILEEQQREKAARFDRVVSPN
jgi:hypothetical protein